MSNASILVNLEELLASRCLSRTTIAFEHESSGLSCPHQETDSNEEQKKMRLTHLNAAKVTLLLAESVVRHRAGVEADVFLSSLRARDFCLAFQCPQPFPEKQPMTGHEAAACSRGSSRPCDYRGSWILLRVEIAPINEQNATIVSDDEDDNRTALSPMQNLGKIFHSVFANSSGSRPLLATAQTDGATDTEGEEQEEEGAEARERKTKISKARTGDAGSLFSTLLNGGDCPVAVCRLLSDMIASDEESEGKGVISYDDVVHDLKQMSDHPEIFLFDQSYEFYSTNLTFGQQCYGRTKELAQLLAISTALEQSPSSSSRSAAEAVFVSGIAGSGKSHFVQSVSTFLTNVGWLAVHAKFQRTMEHGSREIVSGLFRRLVARLVAMKSSKNEADVSYSRRATIAISEALDWNSLSCLAHFIPTIRMLIPDVDLDRGASLLAEGEMSHWQLVFLLSELMAAILSLDRHILICIDDIQWCDRTTLILIKEIVMSIGQDQKGRQRFLFVGMYRCDEIKQSHPLASELATLTDSSIVAVTEIKLSSLSTEDIADMIMSETRLPRRLVRGLADVVQKKTSGHALFAVQFLNSLVSESEIVYSPRNHRFEWDEREIANLGTWDSVANLIVSSLSSTTPEELRTVRILACLGMQSELSLIKLIDTSSIAPPGGGMGSSLAGLLEKGILKISGQLVVFSHDLIQQYLYDIPFDERSKIHLDIGVFLGAKTSLDESTEKSSIEGGLDSLNFSDGSSHSDQSANELTLISIAVNQINAAGREFINEGRQLTRFAGWFLHAGTVAAECSNFQAALFNYKNGIEFLAKRLWLGDSAQLCRELHEGAAFASFALGSAADVETYTSAIIQNVSLEDSLVAQAHRVRSLRQAGRYNETIATGLAVLRLLSIDIPSASSPMEMMGEMTKTGQLTSQYTSKQIINMRQASINTRKQNVLKIVEAMIAACYREASPYLLLVACGTINYSFQNGISGESAAAFAVYGFFQILLREDFEEGKRWGDIALNIMGTDSMFTPMVLHGFLLFWFTPHQEVANALMEIYETGMKIGDVDNAINSLVASMRFSLFGGMNLSLLSQAYHKHLKQIAKYNKEALEFALVDLLLVEGLTGVNSHSFSLYGGMTQDENYLLVQFKNRMDNEGIEQIYTSRFMSAFWAGNYTKAGEWLELASALPSSKTPKIQLIYRTFFSALLVFWRYRQGDGEECLAQGETILEKMKLWSNNSNAIFENKLLLIESEWYACSCNIVAAKESYVLSAKSARDHGLINEQGLAFELYGNFLSSIGDLAATQFYQKAHSCYIQWGALAKAKKLQKNLNLDLTESVSCSLNSSLSISKRSRGKEEDLLEKPSFR